MIEPAFKPRVTIFVCCNGREDMQSCGAQGGEEIAAGFRHAITRHGLTRDVWLVRTRCIGYCPKEGSAVAVHPPGRCWVEVTARDVPCIMNEAVLPVFGAGSGTQEDQSR
ncbi:MAG: hypothetical protein GMKNLPBB_01156 [Myxococcota bacterium]|nr:hypothetical protein [Myxococcota bacterium]